MHGSEPDTVRILPEQHFSSAIIEKVLKLVPLTATGPKVYVATMITALFYSYVLFGGDSEPHEYSQTQGSSGVECCKFL